MSGFAFGFLSQGLKLCSPYWPGIDCIAEASIEYIVFLLPQTLKS